MKKKIPYALKFCILFVPSVNMQKLMLSQHFSAIFSLLSTAVNQRDNYHHGNYNCNEPVEFLIDYNVTKFYLKKLKRKKLHMLEVGHR